MTKLPPKELLDGSKLPKTTTGEMKDALGKLRDYLNDLFGEDSADKAAARLALGIDLAELGDHIEGIARTKADQTELENRTRELEEKVTEKGVPVGSVHYFAMAEPPAGYLKADGSAVDRERYPDLFAAIGTTFGQGDGTSTFNLPNLMGRFVEGNATPGTVKEAGLPNIAGQVSNVANDIALFNQGGTSANGCFDIGWGLNNSAGNLGEVRGNFNSSLRLDASRSSPVYGASDTVQPPSLTLLPCIRARS